MTSNYSPGQKREEEISCLDGNEVDYFHAERTSQARVQVHVYTQLFVSLFATKSNQEKITVFLHMSQCPRINVC